MGDPRHEPTAGARGGAQDPQRHRLVDPRLRSRRPAVEVRAQPDRTAGRAVTWPTWTRRGETGRAGPWRHASVFGNRRRTGVAAVGYLGIEHVAGTSRPRTSLHRCWRGHMISATDCSRLGPMGGHRGREWYAAPGSVP